MLLVLKKNVSMKLFFLVPKTYVWTDEYKITTLRRGAAVV